jgi:hypothetical protein
MGARRDEKASCKALTRAPKGAKETDGQHEAMPPVARPKMGGSVCVKLSIKASLSLVTKVEQKGTAALDMNSKSNGQTLKIPSCRVRLEPYTRESARYPK